MASFAVLCCFCGVLTRFFETVLLTMDFSVSCCILRSFLGHILAKESLLEACRSSSREVGGDSVLHGVTGAAHGTVTEYSMSSAVESPGGRSSIFRVGRTSRLSHKFSFILK